MARFALGTLPVNMTQKAISGPDMPWVMPQTYFIAVWTFWVLLAVQIIIYPVLAILVERGLHGINFRGRALTTPEATDKPDAAIQTVGLTKVYQTPWYKKIFGRGKGDNLTALNGLDLVAQERQILCLLGVNGAGKSTTLDLLSGFQAPTAGQIIIKAPPAQLGMGPATVFCIQSATVVARANELLSRPLPPEKCPLWQAHGF